MASNDKVVLPGFLKCLQKEGIMRIHFTPGRMLYHLRRTGLKNAMHNFRIIMRAIDAPSRLKQAAVALVK